MIVFRYLFAEAFKSTIAVLLVLMAIFVSREFVSVLSDAADGDIPGTIVAQVIGLHLPSLLVMVMPLSVFIGILMAHSRMYSEHEMTVLHACGISEWYVARVTLIVALVFSLIAASITLWFAPWAKEQEYQMVEKAHSSSGLATLQEGRFQRTANNRAVVFIENIDDGHLDKVFVAQLPGPGDSPSVLMAEGGVVSQNDKGMDTMELNQGYRYEGEAGQAALQEVHFGLYKMQIGDQEVQKRNRKLSALPLGELLKDDSVDARAELQWRMALPIAVLLLSLIAVPMAQTGPRQGKFAKMLPALGLFLGYLLLLLAGNRALEDGKIPIALGLWWIHASALFIGIALIIKGRTLGTRIRGWLRGSR
ncbi:MAG: LPS export ABC transporter permease LptF [Pseudomonadota bacterium]|uniref:LPS export ABC transporter permease LptF n=1 Tax=Gallaecimonas pentaromativorans TaxID=584787 RepID=UPI00067E7101|nr:LPS export ABC transporter permease LptF [Gallaecimonas pentaromativorans]MED5524717.1 LPS export ABC transporter permease LptF [Pseudomonadota bacterium]